MNFMTLIEKGIPADVAAEAVLKRDSLTAEERKILGYADGGLTPLEKFLQDAKAKVVADAKKVGL